MSLAAFETGQRTVSKLRNTYVLALVIVGLAVLAEIALTEITLSAQTGTAEIVNVAGRQRMLSQRIAKNRLLASEDDRDAEQLRADITELQDAHAWLSAKLLGHALQARLRALDNTVAWFGWLNQLDISSPVGRSEFKVKVDDYLREMDAIVDDYSGLSEASLQRIINIKRGIALLTLLLLGLEFRLIVNPVLDLARRQVSYLQEAYLQSSENFKVMSAQARDLERAISVERETALSLGRSQSRLRDIMDAAADGLVVADLSDFKVEMANTAFLAAFGSTMHGAESNNLLTTLVARTADNRDWRLSIEQLLLGEQACRMVRTESPTGEVREFEMTAARLDSDTPSCVCIFREVTERNRTLARVNDLDFRNDELQQFAHGVSHDLKEPLRTMSSFAGLLRRRYADCLTSEGLEYVEAIVEAGRRGTQFVSDVLGYAESAEGAVQLVPVDLNEVMGHVQGALADSLKAAGVRIEAESLPSVLATGPWCQQLLQNLVSNAIKYKRDGVAPVIAVSSEASAAWHTIYVQDNGIGIDAADQQRVFEPFQRVGARAAVAGTGIGLATCRRIVTRLGGTLELVSSAVGQGSTFALKFSRKGELAQPTRQHATLRRLAA